MLINFLSAEQVISIFGRPRNAQEGVWHSVSCPEFRSGENIDGVYWYKGESIDDQSKVRLVSRFLGKVYPGKDRFNMTSDFRLVIQGVVQSDEGKYLCEVVPRYSESRVGDVYINVIGMFLNSTVFFLVSISFE